MGAFMNCHGRSALIPHRKQHQHLEHMEHINHSSRPRRLTAISGSFAAVVSIGAALVLPAAVRFGQAAEIKIVSPSSYINREGESVFGGAFATPYRYQQVFPAADFAALGNQPHWIVGFGPRADQSVTSPHTAYLPDNEVRLSTTGRAPNNLSLSLDANHGSDVIQFYSGPLTMVADVAGPGPGPREFYHADFPAGVTPFLYDPSRGNLLFDFIAWQGESPKVLADQIPAMLTNVAGDPLDTQGNRGPAAVFQFTFVPVPKFSNPHWSGDQFQFTLTGETNVNYVIHASTTLQSWTPVATNSSPQASRTITINAPDRLGFYRAVVAPH
jgi:hypothetical protein